MAIVKSKRTLWTLWTLSSTEFFDKAITLRSSIMKVVMEDFGDDKSVIVTKDENGNEVLKRNKDFWMYQEVRNRIYKYLADFIANLTAANTIYITNQSEYGQRRKYMTEAISNLQQTKQELMYAIKILPISAKKYLQWNDEMDLEIEHIKNWRKSDNKVLNKLKGKDD